MPKGIHNSPRGPHPQLTADGILAKKLGVRRDAITRLGGAERLLLLHPDAMRVLLHTIKSQKPKP